MTVYELTSRLLDEAFELDWILKGLIRTAEDAANNPLSDFDKADLRCDLWQFFNSEYSDVEVEEWAKDDEDDDSDDDLVCCGNCGEWVYPDEDDETCPECGCNVYMM